MVNRVLALVAGSSLVLSMLVYQTPQLAMWIEAKVVPFVRMSQHREKEWQTIAFFTAVASLGPLYLALFVL